MATLIPPPPQRVVVDNGWRPPAGVRVISSDDHLTEVEHLWEDRLPAQFRDRAPRWYRDERGVFNLEVDGQSREVPGITRERDRPGASDLAARIADMDADGVDEALAFHQRTPALYGHPDDDFIFACMDAFNEWFAEEGRRPEARGRIHPIAILATWRTPERTADYLQKIKALGYRAMELPSEPRDIYYNSARFEPMWAAIAESGIPLSFHVGPHVIYRGAGSLGANLTRNFAPHRPLWALLTFAGVFERHPELKVVFTEGGASWAASAIDDADKVYRAYYRDLSPKLAEPPSFYWRRNCYATFMDDPSAILLADRIGVENIMWSSDYPHAEGTLGSTRDILQWIFDTLGDEKAAKVVGGNAARLWGI